MSLISGMVFPGFAFPTSWNTPFALAQPAAIKALGFNTLTLQTTYKPPSDTAVTIPTTGAVALSDITAMTSAARAAGLKVCIKPHCYPANGLGSYYMMPGAQKTTVGPDTTAGNAHYNTGSPLLTSATINVSQATDVGKRVVTPSYGFTNEIPNSGLSNYGHTTPAWTTIASVQDPTHLTMSAPATVSSGNAFVYILDDVAAATWFSNWSTILHNLMDAAAAGGGAHQLNISTENVYLTCYYEAQWRALIADLRRAYPGVEIYAGTAGCVGTKAGDQFASVTDVNRVPFIDALDYLAISCYPTVDLAAGGGSVAAMQANWANLTNGLRDWADSWKKPLLFAEVGTESRVAAGYNPASSATDGVPSQVDQASFVRAMFGAMLGQRWWAGFNWWNWYYANNNVAGEDVGTSFAPKPQAQAVFNGYLVPLLGSPLPRLVSAGGQNYRL